MNDARSACGTLSSVSAAATGATSVPRNTKRMKAWSRLRHTATRPARISGSVTHSNIPPNCVAWRGSVVALDEEELRPEVREVVAHEAADQGRERGVVGGDADEVEAGDERAGVRDVPGPEHRVRARHRDQRQQPGAQPCDACASTPPPPARRPAAPPPRGRCCTRRQRSPSRHPAAAYHGQRPRVLRDRQAPQRRRQRGQHGDDLEAHPALHGEPRREPGEQQREQRHRRRAAASPRDQGDEQARQQPEERGRKPLGGHRQREHAEHRAQRVDVDRVLVLAERGEVQGQVGAMLVDAVGG